MTATGPRTAPTTGWPRRPSSAALGGLPAAQDRPRSARAPTSSSTTPHYAAAVAPLADWKTRKGCAVITVTTDETGSRRPASRPGCRTPTTPGTIRPSTCCWSATSAPSRPTASSGNVTDLPYVLLDGDDWLPDAMIGRFPVEQPVAGADAGRPRPSATSARPIWPMTRLVHARIMVAGLTGSTTPPHTVAFCGQQLAVARLQPAHGRHLRRCRCRR